MDDEFKLCWKNFQDNIASGFQNLYDRGDLVDVTLACDGKLLHAHKIVLAICSPYFQEIFITNPCKHPIIILKDVTFNIMCELLEFMYQGVVNVKHTELQSFMKIGQLLQIKGLATNTSSSAPSTSSEKSTSQTQNAEEPCGNFSDTANNGNAKNTITPSETTTGESCSSAKLSNITTQSGLVKSQSPSSSPTPTATATPTPTPTPMSFTTSLTQQSFKNSPENNLSLHHLYHSGSGVKRHPDYNTDALSIRKQFRRSIPSADNNNELNDSTEGGNIDQVNAEEFFLSSLPHISSTASPAAVSLRNSLGPTAFGFDYNMYKGSSTSSGGGSEYPNDLHLPSDYSKNFGNHMDIPPIAPGEHWFQGKLEFMLSQRGKPLLVHDGHTFGIQYVRKDKKYWQCNLSRKFNCKARVTTTDTGEIIVTNNEHCHTEIRQHLRKDYQRNKVMMNALINLSTKNLAENLRRHHPNSLANLSNFPSMVSHTVSGSHVFSTHTTNTCDSGIIDLGKTSTSVSAEEGDGERAVDNNMLHSINNEVPLDCGLRSAKTEDSSKEENVTSMESRQQSESDWKCKNEILDS